MIVENGKYHIENWKEVFKIKAPEGLLLTNQIISSPLYLPVKKSIDSMTYECWLLPLAPFVWLFYLAGGIAAFVWMDMFKWLEMINLFVTKKINHIPPTGSSNGKLFP